jgi:hypothetical protein
MVVEHLSQVEFVGQAYDQWNVVNSFMVEKKSDFSVVMFRLHFMLVSEGHLMKSHKNQWLLNLPPPLISLGSHVPGYIPWYLGCRHLRSDVIGDDPLEI